MPPKWLGYTIVTGFLALLLVISPAFTKPPAADGKALYDSKCAMCHGTDGKGDTKSGKMMKVPDLTGTAWKHGTSQADVEKVILQGAGKMPQYEGKLSGEEVTVVAEYTRKLTGVDKK